MAEGKNKIIVYADWINKFDKLSDEEAGKLIKHFFRYVNDLNPEFPDRLTELLFSDIESTLKRDLVKWEKKAATSRENGAKGGRPKKTHKNPEKPIRLNGNPEKPVRDSVRVSDLKSISLNGEESEYSEQDFLSDWSKARKHYLNKPTGFKKLTSKEKMDFLVSSKQNDKNDFIKAMKGLFQQEVINFEAMTLRPKHFLENVEEYKAAFESKSFQMYGKKQKQNRL